MRWRQQCRLATYRTQTAVRPRIQNQQTVGKNAVDFCWMRHADTPPPLSSRAIQTQCGSWNTKLLALFALVSKLNKRKHKQKKTVCLYCGEGDGAFGAYAMMVMVQCWSINPDYGMGRCET